MPCHTSATIHLRKLITGRPLARRLSLGLTESLRHESGSPLRGADLRQLVLNCLGQERPVGRGTRVSWRGAQIVINLIQLGLLLNQNLLRESRAFRSPTRDRLRLLPNNTRSRP